MHADRSHDERNFGKYLQQGKYTTKSTEVLHGMSLASLSFKNLQVCDNSALYHKMIFNFF